uniref:Uncharacterized protein n=1 Tax=Ciona intestinalis TaxID=7719 RepID=H2XV78_CIOIN
MRIWLCDSLHILCLLPNGQKKNKNMSRLFPTYCITKINFFDYF